MVTRTENLDFVLPEELEAVIMKCLARKPQDRYSSAQEVLRAWRTLGAPTVQPRVIPIHSGVASGFPTTCGTVHRGIVSLAFSTRVW